MNLWNLLIFEIFAIWYSIIWIINCNPQNYFPYDIYYVAWKKILRFENFSL